MMVLIFALAHPLQPTDVEPSGFFFIRLPAASAPIPK